MTAQDPDLRVLLSRLTDALEGLAPKPPPDPDLAGAEFRAKIAGRPCQPQRRVRVAWPGGATATLILATSSDGVERVTRITDYVMSEEQETTAARSVFGGLDPHDAELAVAILRNQPLSDHDLRDFERESRVRKTIEGELTKQWRQERFQIQKSDWSAVTSGAWGRARSFVRVIDSTPLDPRTNEPCGPTTEGDA